MKSYVICNTCKIPVSDLKEVSFLSNERKYIYKIYREKEDFGVQMLVEPYRNGLQKQRKRGGRVLEKEMIEKEVTNNL